MSDRGLYPKYHVAKVADPAHTHDDCFYFVLDLTHDEGGREAALRYADYIEPANPALAIDLRRAVHEAREAAQDDLLPHEHGAGLFRGWNGAAS